MDQSRPSFLYNVLSRATSVLLLLPLLLGFGGCMRDSGPMDSYEHALAIERELLRQHPQADYSHNSYLSVLKALRRVERSHKNRDKAQALAQRIADGRRFALAEKYPQELGRLPNRLKGHEKPLPTQRVKPPPRPPATVPGAQKSVERFQKGRLKTPLTVEEKAALDITLYSTSWCGYCKKARRWFTEQGLPFVEKDIEKDAAANREYQSKAGGYKGVPLLDINGQIQRGFAPVRVEAAIVAAVR